ncbi:MAG: alpha/beta fold hydrolase [Clostridia bacterium]|nr:alpha/beta fold hydrolase [Clostridia bacterium]
MPSLILIILALVVFLAISGFAVMLFITYPISKNVYNEYLVKSSDDKWGRTCSAPENAEQVQMWDDGNTWGRENKSAMTEVSIRNDGLSLFGEYFDFGGDTCVVILPGRCECLQYSYYFAKPYQEAGYNVLVIDSRCHGKSDGKYSTIGRCEAEDLKAWIKFIKEEFGINRFWLHGICVGSAAALLAASSEDCPKGIEGIVLEGCFTNFRESFKQHIIEKKKPVFPVLDLVMYHIWRNAGTNVMAKSPIKAVKNIRCPILFLFGKKDIFSLPPKSQKLFDACASADKKLVWFDKGSHSHLRINNTEKYDAEIKEFINAYEKTEKQVCLLHN